MPCSYPGVGAQGAARIEWNSTSRNLRWPTTVSTKSFSLRQNQYRSRQNQFGHGKINLDHDKVNLITWLAWRHVSSQGALGAYPTWRWFNGTVKSYKKKFKKCFEHIVSLRSQTERTSASSVEKVCYYLQVHTMHIWIFFQAILKPRAVIHKVCFLPNKASWEDYNRKIPAIAFIMRKCCYYVKRFRQFSFML